MSLTTWTKSKVRIRISQKKSYWILEAKNVVHAQDTSVGYVACIRHTYNGLTASEIPVVHDYARADVFADTAF